MHPLALKAYSLPSVEPTYATPLTTAGEESTAAPVAAVHTRPSVETLPDPMPFSKMFHPWWLESKLACAQSVRTVTGIWGAAALVRPTAVIQCWPGTAGVGM